MYLYLRNAMSFVFQIQVSQINKSLSQINPNASKTLQESKRRFRAAASAAFTFLGCGWLRASATRHARLITPESVNRVTRRHICLGAQAFAVNPRLSTSISRVNQPRLKLDYSVNGWLPSIDRRFPDRILIFYAHPHVSACYTHGLRR